MIDDFRQIEALFKELNGVMHNKVKLYVIGGAVLLEQGLKAATKDIDAIVETKKELFDLQLSLQGRGFKPRIPGKEYSRMNLSQIFLRDGFRLDIFQKSVCGRFSLSDGMISRAKKAMPLGRLEIFLCSNEDVFLFKTMTERDGDLTDCESIVGAAVDWGVIIKELKEQISESRQDVWITWVGERFDILEERGMVISIMEELNKLRKKYFYSLERKHAGK
jgi:hypothetical protein